MAQNDGITVLTIAPAGSRAPRAPDLLRNYQRDPAGFAAGWAGDLLVVLDSRFGLLLSGCSALRGVSLYRAVSSKKIVVGSDPREVARAVGEERAEIDGLAQHLLLNYSLADGSFLAGVRPMAAGVLSTIGWSGERIGGRVGPPPWREASAEGDLREAISAAVERSAPSDRRLGFHLSGGVDTAIVVHSARAADPRRRLATLTGFYEPDDADRSWAAVVAEEVRSEHLEVAFDASNDFPAAIDDLVNRLGTPVMATGVATFWLLARAASAHRLQRIVSGVAADHVIVGRTRLDRLGAIDASANSVFARCVAHLDAEMLAPFVVSAELQGALRNLGERLAQYPVAGESVRDAVERFHDEHFLPEHLRQARVAHTAWAVDIVHPFLDPAVFAIGYQASREDAQAREKRFLRTILASYGSAAADRGGKQQMAIGGDAFRAVCGAQLAEMLAEDGTAAILGLDTERLLALLRPTKRATPQHDRLLWLVYSYLRWWKSPPSLPDRDERNWRTA
jgi:asparagine synthetase B (glutamine-hydrolysing)